MKKHLISTSAIALGVAMAAPVAAQEWDVGVGGYMRQHVGFRDLSGSALDTGSDYDGVQFHSKSQIHFNPSITLDNGLTFGATVKLQTENKGASQQIDEGYMTISGDTLGKIMIGSKNSAGYQLMVGAPGVVSQYINSPSISTYIPFSNVTTSAGKGVFGFRQAGLSTNTEVGGNNDVQRLTYFTPSFNGLTLGVSYAANGSSGGYVQNNYDNPKESLHDIFDIGANYSQTFGTTSVSLSARYGTGTAARGTAAIAAIPPSIVGTSAGPDGVLGTGDDEDVYDAGTPAVPAVGKLKDPETWGVGAQIGFGDFTVGGSWTENYAGASGPGNSEGWSLGATYDAPGPWAFEAQTYQGKIKTAMTNLPGNSKAKYEAYQIGATRDLGPGVSWDVYVAHVKADNGEVGANRSNIKGTVLGTGVNISF